jgi:hypothetical protein
LNVHGALDESFARIHVYFSFAKVLEVINSQPGARSGGRRSKVPGIDQPENLRLADRGPPRFGSAHGFLTGTAGDQSAQCAIRTTVRPTEKTGVPAAKVIDCIVNETWTSATVATAMFEDIAPE